METQLRRRFDVLIVGAGHAGAQCAIALRHKGFTGSIALIGDEPDLPYDRPALSKDYLAGEKTITQIRIRSETFWTERGIVLELGRRVEAIDPVRGEAALSNDDVIAYGTLVWASGGTPKRLSCPGHDLAGIHVVRSRADTDRMISDLPAARDIVVIGGGYIGLEVAAVLRKLGKTVTLLETQDRVLARVAGEPISRFFEREHRSAGVDVRLGTQVNGFEGELGRVTGVRTAGHKILPAQLVVVGIGIVPAVGPLLEAGARGGDGVDVDAYCRTSLSNIFAIGDCARHSNAYAGGDLVRIESIQNASDQANTVADAIMDQARPYRAAPWFWSNQYDLKLQTFGLSTGHDDLVTRGSPDARSFSVFYLKEGRVIAVDSVNAVRDHMQSKRFVEQRLSPDRAALADLAVALKEQAVAL